jgi:CRISPR-associated endonuclease/helicase Cas3
VISKQYIAHIREKDGHIQPLIDHLRDVGNLAREFVLKVDTPNAGNVLGLLHDFGKFSQNFQVYIKSATGVVNPDDDVYVDAGKLKGKIDHSSAGAQLIWQRLHKFGKHGQGEIVAQMLALCIASHHSGLINCVDKDGRNTFNKRMEKADEETHLLECLMQAEAELISTIDRLVRQEMVINIFEKLSKLVDFSSAMKEKKYSKIDSFNLGFFTRFLFSCLVDADRLNSAEFENPTRKEQRLSQQAWLNWDIAIERFESHLGLFEQTKPIDEIRRRISDNCKQRANDPQGIYSLTVPTGGGKTLSSLRYALHHAREHNLDRIIYIIPYTSIIEQNAQAVREIIKQDDDLYPWVLEHHSNIEPENQTWHSKLVSENWDAPIIFTTMVQFLESLFSGGTRSVRRMHQLANSVLVFDEIQTLPINCVHLFCNALNFLTQHAKTTALLCTATQPLLDNLRFEDKGQLVMADNAELVDNIQQLFIELSRVQMNNLTKIGGWTCEEIKQLALDRFNESGSCLIIVNTKQWAQDLYQICMDDVDRDAIFHLSTSLYPVHRKSKLDAIRGRLLQGLPVLCISTQLIEAGVDISFGAVIRFLAGLDSIAQAAGRCNRHGELKDKNGISIKGQVDVINPDSEPVELLKDIQVGKEKTQRVFSEIDSQAELLAPETMKRYFQYYFYDRSSEMDYPVFAKDHAPEQTLLNLLSQNSLNTNADEKRRLGKLPLMHHSFMDAGKLFKAIDAPTRAVIIQHGKGKELVTELCRLAKEFEPQAYYQTLKAAQQYSVNVFPNIWKKLISVGAVYETQPGEGIYFLDEAHYSEEFGVSIERVKVMENLIFNGVL